MKLYSLKTNAEIGIGQVVEYLPGRRGLHIDWVKVTVINPGGSESVHLRWPNGQGLWTTAADIGARIGNKKVTVLGVGRDMHGAIAGVKIVPADAATTERYDILGFAPGVYNAFSKLTPDKHGVLTVSLDVELERRLKAAGAEDLGAHIWRVGVAAPAPQILALQPAERDAILAGLRLLQTDLDIGDHLTPQLRDIYTNGDAHLGLTVDEIDALCERINLGG